MPTREEYHVRVVYQSGHVEEFWVTKFEVTRNENSVTITFAPVEIRRPLELGLPRVESIWQIGVRTAEYKEETAPALPPSSITLN